MAVENLAVFVLQQIGAVAMQHARLAGVHRGAVLDALEPAAAGLDADDLHRAVVEEGMEHADGIRAAADSGNDDVGQPALLLKYLASRLRADHRLEVAHHLRIGVRACSSADQVIGVLDIGDPIPQRFVHGVLQRAMTGGDRTNLGAQELHAEDVGFLTLDVGGAHIDDARVAETSRDGGGGDAMLAGAGLGDDAFLAHALGKQDLAEAVVDLVRAGMVQILALEIDLCAAEMLRQAFRKIELRGPAGIMRRKP